jgi:hypothetical protein
MRLAGVLEIARALDVDRSVVYYWIKRPGFPEPLAELSTGRVWDLDAVIKWREEGKGVRIQARPGPKPKR